MKKLQNNFTTPEQSKRLLELGVPAWTADCYYYGDFDKHPKVSYIDADRDYNWNLESEYYPKPCWSIGRLVEIYLLCAELKKPQMIFIKEDVLMMDRMINELCYMAESERLDLSKLEL